MFTFLRFIGMARLVVLFLLLSPQLHSVSLAADFTWVGIGSNGNWGDPFQWDGFLQAPPTNGAFTNIFLRGSDSSPDIQDITNVDTDYHINSLELTSLYNGGTLFLSGGELTVDTEVTNRNSSELDFTPQINLGGPLINIRAVNGNIDFNAPVQSSHPNSIISVSGINRDIYFDGGITTDTPGIETTLQIGLGTLARLGGTTTNLKQINIDGGRFQVSSFFNLLSNTSIDVGTNSLFDLNDSNQSIEKLTGDGAVDLGAGTLLIQPSDAAPVSFLGSIEGSGNIIYSGAGTMSFLAQQTYAGSTSIDSGTLRLAGTGGLADASLVSVDNAATFDLNGISDRVSSITGGGTIRLGGGTLTVGEESGTTRTFSGRITEDGGFVKRGSHTLVLTGNNTYTGSTTIREGTLSITSNSQLGDGNLIFTEGTLQVAGNISNTRFTNINASGTATIDIAANRVFTQAAEMGGSQSTLLVKRGAGTFIAAVATADTFSGDILIEDGTFNLSGTGNILRNTTRVTVATPGELLVNNAEDIGSLAGTGEVVLNEILRVGHDNTSTLFAGTLRGSGGFGKRGNGVMTLATNNIYTGITEIDNGTLQLRFGGRLSDSTDLQIAAGASFVIDQLSDTVGSLSGQGDVVLTNGVLLPTLGIGGSDSDGTFGGQIMGAGDLKKVGSGTQTLTGDWNLFGPVAVEGGTLRFAQGATIEVQDLTVGANIGNAFHALIEGGGTNVAILGSFFVGMSSNSLVTIRDQAIVSAEGTTTIQSGSLTLDDGTLDNSSGSGIAITGGMLQGTGDVIGNLLNRSRLAPGLSAGELSLDGDYTQATNGGLFVELGGTNNSNPLAFEFDLLSITGTADLAGVLEVSLLEDFLPQAGDTFEIISAANIEGVFTTETLPTLAGLDWHVGYTPTSVLLSVQNSPLPGDYNADGQVDAADYTVWRDGNSPDSSAAGYDVWAENYDTISAGAASSAATQAVPEPAAVLLLFTSCAAVGAVRRLR